MLRKINKHATQKIKKTITQTVQTAVAQSVQTAVAQSVQATVAQTVQATVPTENEPKKIRIFEVSLLAFPPHQRVGPKAHRRSVLPSYYN